MSNTPTASSIANAVTQCRFCSGPLNVSVADLGLSPVANAFPADRTAAAAQPLFPLHAKLCPQCLLVQLDHSVSPGSIFNDEYAYYSSYSSSWVEHAERYANKMAARFSLGSESLVVEAASNDGYLLRHFVALGVPCLGVEPAGNCAEAARTYGVETLVAFFNAETGARLAARGRLADLMVANNVLAHTPDPKGFVAGFAEVLRPEGVATFEFPHVLRLIKGLQFDTIYHEHYSYLSLHFVEELAASAGLRVFDVEMLPTHGGSLRVFVCRHDAGHVSAPGRERVLAEEREAALDRPEGYRDFSARIDAVRDGFRAFLAQARSDGAVVAAYGAAAKGVTFLNFCGVSDEDIAFVVDRNPKKQGRLVPGVYVPILGPAALRERRPDYVVILPWNLRAEITAEHRYIADWSGRFVVASPALSIIAPRSAA